MKPECKCTSYHTRKKTIYTYNRFTGAPIPQDIDVGICWGTKECDECSCGGDLTQCDFYPKNREIGRKQISIKDAIEHFEYGISHDIFKEPVKSYARLAVEALKKQLESK